jgi:hypothetical protein
VSPSPRHHLPSAANPPNPPVAPAAKPAEFQRYRTALAAAFFGFIALAALVVSASIVSELFFSHRGHRVPGTGSPPDLVSCNAGVGRLLDELSQTAAAVAAEPADPGPGEAWTRFETRWQAEWEEANARCGFSELADTGKGAAYDRMAWVYRSLPTVKLKYRDQLERFSQDLAGDLAQMRRALELSRKDLLK